MVHIHVLYVFMDGYLYSPAMNFVCSSDFTFKCFRLTKFPRHFFDVVKMLFFERCLDPENDIPGDMYTFRYPKKKVGRFVVEVTLNSSADLCHLRSFVSEFGNPPTPAFLQQRKHVGIQ